MKRIITIFRESPLLAGASSAFIVNLLGAFLAFGVQVLIARLMGVTAYGGYTYVLSWLSILVIFGTLGLDSTVLRFIAAYRAEKDFSALKGLTIRSAQIVLVTSILLTALTLVFVYLFRSSFSDEVYACFLVGAFLLPVWAITNVRLATLQSLKRVISARVPHFIVRPLIFGALVFGAFLYRNEQVSAPIAMLFHIISVVAALLAGSWLLTRSLPEETGKVTPSFLTSAWARTGAGLMFVAGMQVILNHIDALMIGMMRGVEEVGVYSAAVRVSMLILFGLQAINTIAAPMISEVYSSKGREALQVLVSKVALWIFIVSVPILMGVVICGWWILGAFGSEFQSAYPALLLLALGQLVNVSVGPVGFLLNMTGHERRSLVILTLSILINAALNVPAIYYFGVTGAAAATGFSIALRNILLWLSSRSLLEVDSLILYTLRMRRLTKQPQNLLNIVDDT